jgi:hypothetical protein
MKFISCSTAIVVALVSCRSTPPAEAPRTGFEALSGPYFGQESAGAKPQLFMPGLISTHRSQGSIVFMDEGKVCVYSEVAEGGHDTYYTLEKDGYWTPPELVPFHVPGEWIDYTSPDGRKLHFQSNRPTSPEDAESDSTAWLVEWTGKGWTEPYRLSEPPKGYPSATLNGTLYFFSTRRPDSHGGDIFRTRYAKGQYQDVERLGWPINTEHFEADPFVAPDESYLLFGSDRPGTLGTTNTFICFRKDDGSWTHPVHLGNELNSTGGEIRVRVTPDGKYFFFYTGRPTDIPKGDAYVSEFTERHGDGDIYWSDTSFIDDLRTRLFDTKCAAEVIVGTYEDYGLEAAMEKLTDLYATDNGGYHFLPWEFLALCEKMIAAGKTEDADRFHEALRETLPERLRLEIGYAVICSLTGRMSRALALLREIASDDPSFDLEKVVYSLSEYQRSHSNQEAELEALRFNVEEFADSYMAYFRLAEAYEHYGDEASARENCNKALELNPDSIIAADLLRKLEEP